jgi:undecaprenyl-diphosphatase
MGRLLTGAGLCVLVLALGELAKAGPVARLELRADEHIAGDRSGALTWLAKLATDIGTPETVGVGLMILVPVILLLMRRRLDAAKVLCMFAGAFALAAIGKQLINEHRPPAALQVVAPDSGASFPSGHATTAAVVAVALVVIAATFALRAAALLLGGLYAVAVAASRVYLGDHYPLDVLAGMLCALAAAFVVTGLAALPALQPFLRRLDRTTVQRLPRREPTGAPARCLLPGGRRIAGGAPGSPGVPYCPCCPYCEGPWPPDLVTHASTRHTPTTTAVTITARTIAIPAMMPMRLTTRIPPSNAGSTLV